MDLVSFVFQEAFMLDDTLYENIRLGRPNATREQVEAAARAAQIHDTIEGLPNGYDTLLGENGVKLSGGERQRVCIARAILKMRPSSCSTKPPASPTSRTSTGSSLRSRTC